MSVLVGVDALVASDREHVWHPYAAMPATVSPLVVKSATGVRLRLARPYQGHDELIDAMSSWWAVIHGYRHPVLDQAVIDQVGRMSHVMFGGLTHEPAVRLVERLVEITPEALQHVFLADSGSIAVEVAIKMALQYWQALGRPEKRRLMTWRGGYYGDTLHPMSICDPVGGMHAAWTGVLPPQVFADQPPAGFDSPVSKDYLDGFEAVLAAHADAVAAIIVEPVVQGAGGMQFHSPAYVAALRGIADRHGVLLIFDEIATGFGRSGTLFAADAAGVSPDIMCVGKALTGGYLSLGATLCTREVATTISEGEIPVLAHGPTFMGNPLACAVSNASIDLLLEQDWQAEVRRVESRLTAGLGPLAAIPGVNDVRVLGAIGVVQMASNVDVSAATQAAARQGVWIRPFRDLIYAMPPYVTGDDDLDRICSAMAAAAEACT